MPADVTWKLNADVAGYTGSVSKIADAHKQVTGHMEKQVELQNVFTNGLERSLFKTIAIVTVVKKLSEALGETIKQAEEMSKKLGADTISTGTSLANLGFKGNDLPRAQEFVNADFGVATLDESQGFASTLSKSYKKGAKLPNEQALGLINAWKRGGPIALGDQEDFIEGYKRTGGGDPEAYADRVAAERLGVADGPGAIERGLAGAGKEINRELDTRAAERQKEIRRREASNSTQGRVARLAAGEYAINKIKSPMRNALVPDSVALALENMDEAKRYQEDMKAANESRQRAEHMLNAIQRKVLADDSKNGLGEIK